MKIKLGKVKITVKPNLKPTPPNKYPRPNKVLTKKKAKLKSKKK